MRTRSTLVIILALQLLLSQVWAGSSFKVTVDSGKYPTVFFYELHDAIRDLKLPATPEDQRQLRKTDREILSHNVNALQSTAQVFGKLQTFGNSFGKELIALIEGSTAINGYKIHQLSKLLRSYHMLSTKMLEFSSIYSLEAMDTVEEFMKEEEVQKTKKHLVWLASNIILFDVLMDAYQVYYTENGRLRRLTKEVEKSNKDIYEQFKDEVKYILTRKNRTVLERHITLFYMQMPHLKQMAATDVELGQLLALIEGSKATNNIIKNKKYYAKSFGVIDGLISFVDKILSLLAQYFSNFTKLFTWRDGYLAENHEAQKHIEDRLNPMDILLTKSPFSLTDMVIPGYTTHAAIYVGSEAKLKAYGLWNHPSIIPHHKKIREGKRVIEAVKYGVLYHTFKKFSETDQVIVIRNKNVHRTQITSNEATERLLGLLGKKYDYGFDAEDIGKVVCSEVVYHTHGDITWPTEYHLGRFTISPDNLASLMYYDNSPLEMAAYVAGKEDKKTYFEISKADLGEKLSFVKNKSRSRERGVESWDKKIKKCRTITRRSSLGKRNRRLRTRRVCTTEYEVHDYLELVK